MKTIDEMVAVMVAFKCGQKIQLTSDSRTQWIDVESPNWNWSLYDYRIKPREPRRIWVREYQSTPGEVMAFNLYERNHHAGKESLVEFVEVLKPE